MSQYCKCLGMFITSCENNTGCENKTKTENKQTNTNLNTKPMI